MPPPLPREHGAWVMLAIPLVLGLAIGFGSLAPWLVVLAVLAAFLGHYALVPALQRLRAGKAAPDAWFRARWSWGARYLASAGASFAAALVLAPAAARASVLGLAIACAAGASVFFVASVLEVGRALWSELIGIAGMALSAALVAAAGGTVDRRAWSAAAVAYAYSLSSVAFVRAYGARRADPRGAVVRCVAAHAAIAAGLILLWHQHAVAGWTIAALAPVVVRTAWGLNRPPPNLRALGRRELVVAVSFVAVAVLSLTLAGCARRAAPHATVARPICHECFWEHQDPAFRSELTAFYEAYRSPDPLVAADVQYLLGRVTGDIDRVCRSFHALSELRRDLPVGPRALLVDEQLAFVAAECGRNPAAHFRRAARSAQALGFAWKARTYEDIAAGRFRPRFGGTVIERRLAVPQGARTMVLGRSTIRVAPGGRIGVQLERTVRDWLSYQMEYDFSGRGPVPGEILDYHEGARLREVLAAGPAMVEPLYATIVARRGDSWYAPDEKGVFRFEVLPDKIEYPTTRGFGDLALLVDTHGLSALVASAAERHVALVLGCADHAAKAEAAYHLARLGIDGYFPCDRFVGDLLGYVGEGVLLGSAPVRIEGGRAIIGDRPVELRLDEVFVVQDTSLAGRYQYYDTAARYFRRLARSVPLQLIYVPVEGPGESGRVTGKAEELGCSAIALRVETEEDYRPVRDWLAASRERRAVLFHSAPYPAGYRLFAEFPGQTTFGDPRPQFE